jgi:L-fuculose-phosphate aldolase
MKKTAPNSTIIHICQKLNQRNLITAYGGNVSMRIGNKVIITPTKFALAELGEDDLVVIDMDGNVLFGVHEPSSETHLHLGIYKVREDVNGIVHTHPAATTAFAYTGEPIIPVNPESMQYLSNMVTVPYYSFGSAELADAAGRAAVNANALILARHGIVALGQDLYAAYNLTELVEQTALMNLYLKILKGGV